MGSQYLEGGETRDHPNQKPEVVAPGVGIISTGSNNAWYSSTGTSDATVFVTAALSLLLEEHPEYRPTQTSNGSCIDAIKVALMNSVQPLHENGLHDDHTGYGELRALDWINEVTSTAPTC
jgi:serine protease AprX